MQKDLYMKSPNEKILVQSDDLKYDGKNIIIPSYYAGIVSEYLTNVDLQAAGFNDADMHDYLAFCSFFEAILDHKNKNIN
jgi:DNA topoisomerase IB